MKLFLNYYFKPLRGFYRSLLPLTMMACFSCAEEVSSQPRGIMTEIFEEQYICQ